SIAIRFQPCPQHRTGWHPSDGHSHRLLAPSLGPCPGSEPAYLLDPALNTRWKPANRSCPTGRCDDHCPARHTATPTREEGACPLTWHRRAHPRLKPTLPACLLPRLDRPHSPSP